MPVMAREEQGYNPDSLKYNDFEIYLLYQRLFFNKDANISLQLLRSCTSR
jgi:hypothetical protein